MSFTKSWNEAVPQGSTTPAAQLDTVIQDFKTAIRERLQLGGMYFPVTDDAEAGEYSYLKIRTSTEKPSAAGEADKLFLYGKDIASVLELFIEKEDGTEVQITSGSVINGSVPSGLIGMWAGTLATIPTGFRLCDGTGGAPNLVAKFVRGIATAATEPGSTGGADTINLEHSHTMEHSHPITDPSTARAWNASPGSTSTGDSTGAASVTDAAGWVALNSGLPNTGLNLSTAQSILPTYYELAYIQKT